MNLLNQRINNFEYRSFFIWSVIFVSTLMVIVFSYLIFIHNKINNQDQLAQIIATKNELTRKFGQNEFPIPKQNVVKPLLSAKSFISVSITNDGYEKILIEENKDLQLPIASITKLMTALIASEKYKLDDIITISENSLKIDGLSGIYHAGDRFFFYNALRAMLVASHNEIAHTFAEQIGIESFIAAMNKKAFELRLSNTEFINETGLDPIIENDPINHSTVFDIYKLARYIKENHSDIFYITSQKEFDLFDINKNFIGTIKNTDKLLIDQEIPFHIIGGKTGATDLAKQSLVIVTEAPCGGKIFNVVLDSQNRFEDMKKILQYVNNSYDWSCSNL